MSLKLKEGMKSRKDYIFRYTKRKLKERDWLRYVFNSTVDHLDSALYWNGRSNIVSTVNNAIKEAESEHWSQVNIFIDRDISTQKIRNEVFVNIIENDNYKTIVQVYFCFMGEILIKSQFEILSTGLIGLEEDLIDAHEQLIRKHFRDDVNETVIDSGHDISDKRRDLIAKFQEFKN